MLLFTDVDEVAFAVQHDVAVVSVFNLQQEEQQTVRCHAADEVVASLWSNHAIQGRPMMLFQQFNVKPRCLDKNFPNIST